MMPTNNYCWLHYLQRLRNEGCDVTCRGKLTSELTAQTLSFDMSYPVITILGRKLSYEFMFAEAEWILSGSNQLNHHSAIKRNWFKFSNDGFTLDGAYGPAFRGQLTYVIQVLEHDPASRQAVLTLWNRKPNSSSKDIPCTISLQFLIRNEHLHCMVHMRSSDAWLGLPYDIFCFSMMAQYIRLSLKETYDIGALTIMMGSSHIYETDYERADALLRAPIECGNYEDMSLYDLNTPDDLMAWLCDNRDNPRKFLV